MIYRVLGLQKKLMICTKWEQNYSTIHNEKLFYRKCKNVYDKEWNYNDNCNYTKHRINIRLTEYLKGE